MKATFESVQGKVAVVTGASRGIGEAIARAFAANGMKVVLAACSEEQGQKVAGEIVAQGGDAVFVRTDCSDPAQIKVLVEKAVETYGRLDGFVSNAGIGMGGNPLHEYEMEEYERIFALNSEGVFAGMKYAAEAIFRSKSKGGFLINVASVAGLVPQRGQALYTATKFGVVGMTRAAALDYAAYGITVNAICPGYTKTSIFGDIPEAAMAMFAKDCPVGRMGGSYGVRLVGFVPGKRYGPVYHRCGHSGGRSAERGTSECDYLEKSRALRGYSRELTQFLC